MDVKNCAEYTIGFCPNEEFYIEGITIKCPFIHSEADKAQYKLSKFSFPWENDCLIKFKEIIADLDRKIQINSKIIKQETIPDNLCKAISECEAQIEQFKIDDSNPLTLHNLLVLHGKLILHGIEQQNNRDIDICTNCSVFKEKNKPCNHVFCRKYSYLREMILILEKRLAEKPKSITNDI